MVRLPLQVEDRSRAAAWACRSMAPDR